MIPTWEELNPDGKIGPCMSEEVAEIIENIVIDARGACNLIEKSRTSQLTKDEVEELDYFSNRLLLGYGRIIDLERHLRIVEKVVRGDYGHN